MAKYEVNLTGTTENAFVCAAKTPRTLDGFGATVVVYGEFGGGTVKLQISPDDGTTKLDAYDTNGIAITGTSNYTATIVTGVADTNGEALKIYADLSGGTNANVNVALYDKKG